MTKIVAGFLLIVATLGIMGCPNPTPGQPVVLDPVATTVLIIGARVGLAQISAAVEKGYADGKLPAAAYTTARGEEQAALNALDALQAKANAGTPVTQADVNTTIVSFVTPLTAILNQYAITVLPPAQPTMMKLPAAQAATH